MLYQRKRIAELDDERLKFEISTIHPREVIRSFTIKKDSIPALEIEIGGNCYQHFNLFLCISWALRSLKKN